MNHFQHRVKSAPPAPPPLPRDTWRGRTYVEGDGTELEVVWNGSKFGPLLSAPIARHIDGPLARIALMSRTR